MLLHILSRDVHINRTGPIQSFRAARAFYPCEMMELADSSCRESIPYAQKPARDINTKLALSYISETDPPPGFEKWLQFAQDNKCLLGSYSRIERDLEASDILLAEPDPTIVLIRNC